MPFNGSGSYSAPVNSWNPAVSQSVIDPADWNATQADYETGLSTMVCRDGQSTLTNNIPFSGFKATGVNTNSGSTSRSEFASGATLQDGAPLDAGSTGGTSTAYTATLTPAIAAYADKQCFRVKFNAACGATPTIDFNSVGAKKIYKNVAGSASQLAANDILANQIWLLRYDATLDTSAGGFMVIGFSAPFTGGTLTSTLTMSGAAINEAKGSDIASAATTDIGAATGNYVDVTGTTTITGLGTVQAGTERIVQFDGALILTHNGTSLILPGGLNITTAAGDVARFVSEGSGNWRLVNYQRASGLPPFTKSYTSASTAVPAAGALQQFAHGLGSVPRMVFVKLICTDAGGEAGYSQNDIVVVSAGMNGGAGISDRGFAMYLDSTNINIRMGDTTGINYFNKANGADGILTNSKWSFIIEAVA